MLVFARNKHRNISTCQHAQVVWTVAKRYRDQLFAWPLVRVLRFGTRASVCTSCLVEIKTRRPRNAWRTEFVKRLAVVSVRGFRFPVSRLQALAGYRRRQQRCHAREIIRRYRQDGTVLSHDRMGEIQLSCVVFEFSQGLAAHKDQRNIPVPE